MKQIRLRRALYPAPATRQPPKRLDGREDLGTVERVDGLSQQRAQPTNVFCQGRVLWTARREP